MSDFLSLALSAASGDEFDEIPVTIEEFVESPDFLSAVEPRRLSPYQYELVKAMTQIYKYDTLVRWLGPDEAEKRWEETFREVVMQLGKGSGKDFTSTIAVAYIVYLCLCLKNPTRYFQNASIDIINVAINADQAQRVFFKNFMELWIKPCPWFQGKYNPGRDNVQFDKNVNVYSGHSEREAYEGYNTLVIILDEISGFALENTTGNMKAKTSDEIFKWARGSVTSRFSQFGKVVSLSFPRFKDDWIQQRYNKVIAEKETFMRRATLKLDPDLPDGYMNGENEFEIEWEEDHIYRYAFPYTFALRRPSWEVNPNKDLQHDYAQEFFENPGDALGRFACMPSNLEDGFFKNMAAVEEAFALPNGVDDYGVFKDDFLPKKGKRYYVHVDLAQKHDHAAVAMAHVDKWTQVSIGAENYKVVHPVVQVDCVRYWTPSKSKSVEFSDIRDFIVALRNRGFDIRLVTFDRWNSHDTMNILEREHGMKTDTLSVDKKHYDDFLSTVYGKRLIGPYIELLIRELGELRQVIKGSKVTIDHPAKGSKDLSDAVCGAIFDAVAHTPKPVDETVEILTLKDLHDRTVREQAEERRMSGVITSPKRKLPDDIQTYLRSLKLL